MFCIKRTNGTNGKIDKTDTMYQVRNDGTIVIGHFDQTTRVSRTILRTWTIPGIHTEVTIRIPAQPSHNAKSAIVHLMDELFQS